MSFPSTPTPNQQNPIAKKKNRRIWSVLSVVLFLIILITLFVFARRNDDRSGRFSLLDGDSFFKPKLEPTIPVAGKAKDSNQPDTTEDDFLADNFDLGEEYGQVELKKYQVTKIKNQELQVKSEAGEKKTFKVGVDAEVILVRSFDKEGLSKTVRMGWENALASGMAEGVWVKVNEDFNNQSLIYQIYFLSKE